MVAKTNQMAQKITSLVNRVIKDGFTEQEKKSIYRYLRIIAFFIGAITLVYFWLLYRNNHTKSFDDFFRLYMNNGTFVDVMFGFFGLLCSPIIVIFVGFYWLFSFINFLYTITVLPIQINIIEPTKNDLKLFVVDIKNKFTNSRIWHLHLRWFNLFEKLGLQLALIRFLSYLEPELENKENIQNFQIESLILSPPYDTPEFITQVRNRYERFESIIFPIWILISLVIFVITIMFVFSIVGFVALPFLSIFFVISIFWCELLWGIALFGFMNPVRRRRAAWYREYKSANDREYRDWTIRQLEQEILQPDSRIEKLKELLELQSQELRELANKNTENENDKVKFSVLIKNQQDTIDKLFLKYNDLMVRQNEVLEKSKKPATIAEGLSINIVASIVFVILSDIASFIIGLWSKKP